MKRALVLIAFAALGCGSSSPQDALQGSWITDPSAQCALGIAFDGSDVTLARACATGAASGEAEETIGTFTADGSTIDMVFNRSSCTLAPEDKHLSSSYDFTGGLLRLSDSSGVILLQRNNDPASSGTITLGCFASDGTFTPQPLTSQ
jgi:hypothetical protein